MTYTDFIPYFVVKSLGGLSCRHLLQPLYRSLFLAPEEKIKMLTGFVLTCDIPDLFSHKGRAIVLLASKSDLRIMTFCDFSLDSLMDQCPNMYFILKPLVYIQRYSKARYSS